MTYSVKNPSSARFKEWCKTARRGEKLVYYIGELGKDAFIHRVAKSISIYNTTREYYELGAIDLFQKSGIKEFRTEYIAVRK